MTKPHDPRWTSTWWSIWFRRESISTYDGDELFDPRSLYTPKRKRSPVRAVCEGVAYALLSVAPAIYLFTKTRQAANVYYQPAYAALLAFVVAAFFAVEVANRFHKLLTKPSAKESPFFVRLARFFFASAVFLATVLIGSQLALTIENYWLFFAVGYYSPYLVHHILLAVLLAMAWRWYEKLARAGIRPTDRKKISGRDITDDDEADNRREELFD